MFRRQRHYMGLLPDIIVPPAAMNKTSYNGSKAHEYKSRTEGQTTVRLVSGKYSQAKCREAYLKTWVTFAWPVFRGKRHR